MSKFGIILGVTSLILMFVFIVVGGVLKKISFKQIKVKLAITLIISIIGLFGFLWFVFFRYIGDVISLIENKDSLDNNVRSIYWSKVLLLDLCPFAYVVLTIFMVVDYKRKYTNIVAIWAMIGSIITIFGSVWITDFPIEEWYKYIFIGSSEGQLYFWIHIYMLIFGSFLIAYTARINFIRSLIMHLVVSLYLCYVIIIVKNLNVIRNATGLVEFDWINNSGEYHAVYLFFNLPYIDILFLSYFLVWVGLIIIISLKNLFSSPKEYAFFPKIIYEKLKVIKIISEKCYQLKYKLWTKLKLIRFN